MQLQSLTDGIFLGSEIISAVVMAMMIIAILVLGNIKKTENWLYLLLCISHFLTLALDIPYEYLVGFPQYYMHIKWLTAVLYWLVNATVVLFTFYIVHSLRKKVYIASSVGYYMIMISGCGAIIFTSDVVFNSGLFTVISRDAVIRTTEYTWMCYAIPIFVVFFVVMLAWSCQEVLSVREVVCWIAYIVSPLTGILFSPEYGPGIIYSSFAIAILFVFIFEHSHKEKENAAIEVQLTQSRAKLMVSQIQPHFMYNALNSIYYLIEQNPETAQEAVSDFSDYLRQNINALKNDGPVLFEEELQHTKVYLSLEKLRFGEKLNVKFDIKCSSFKLPALSLQPIVENAVKHGISRKEDGGTVSITAEENEKQYIVKVEDDGVGFDAAAEKDPAHTHIGLVNVSSRLENMCGGHLEIESQVGKGTVCEIILPKEVQGKL